MPTILRYLFHIHLAIGLKHKVLDKDNWHILTPRYEPKSTLVGHLEFALKHEGIDLCVLKKMFEIINPDEIVAKEAGGFIGEHDRSTGAPLPEHISARYEDIETLIKGMLEYSVKIKGEIDPVVAAAAISFGFVYIHPFSDGNRRIHRYLIHQELCLLLNGSLQKNIM